MRDTRVRNDNAAVSRSSEFVTDNAFPPCRLSRTAGERGNAENLARFCHLTTPGNRFDRTIFIATRGNYGVGALIRHADSGRGTFSSADRMIVRIQCAVAFGSWQFGAGGRERRNKLSESCRADEKSLSGRKRSGGLSLLFSLFLSVCFSHSPSSPRALSPILSRTSFQRRSVGRGGGNNQRKFDGNIRMRSSDRAMCSDIFEYRPLRHVGRRRCARSINSMRN